MITCQQISGRGVQRDYIFHVVHVLSFLLHMVQIFKTLQTCICHQEESSGLALENELHMHHHQKVAAASLM